MTDRHDPDRSHVGWDIEQRRNVVDVMRTKEPRSEVFVDCCKEEEHHRRTGIDPPVGDGPAIFGRGGRLRTALVEFPVALEIGLLAHAHDDVHRSARDPRVEASGHVFVLAGEAGDLSTRLGIGDDDEGDTLGEPSARSPLGCREDPLESVTVDRIIRVVADHPATANDVSELHQSSMSASWMFSSALFASENSIIVDGM